MSRIYVPTSGPESWRRLLAAPEKHWRTGYSAKAAAYCWESADGLPTEVNAIFGGKAELLLAIPEHKVALPGGRSASQCDVFALVRSDDNTYAVAVEAKVDEPFGPTVEEWLENASDGKKTRLRFLCETIGLESPPKGQLRYQLLHRTAAAILEANRFDADAAAMVVHSFSTVRRWFEDFGAFCEALGHQAEPDVPISHTLPNGKPLLMAWVSGDAKFLSV